MFCGRNDIKITKEHVFPDWLNQLFDSSIKGINESVTLDGRVVYRYESKLFSRTINDVCETCNSGWMSNLENEVKPILTKMLRSKNIVLDKVKQRRLATWAYKTMLVMNYQNPPPPEQQIIPESAYSDFYETKTIAQGLIFTLGYVPWKTFHPGSMLGTNRVTQASKITVPHELGDEMKKEIAKGAKIYGVTLQLATVVFQFMTTDIKLENHHIDLMISPEPLKVLNPYKNKIRWPLQHSIQEVGGIDAIHNSITNMQPLP